jgi:hypothetical protein
MDYEGKCSCILCKDVKYARGIHTHIDRTHLKSTKYSSGHNGKYDQISERARNRKKNEEILYLLQPKVCLECSEILPFEIRHSKFCSKSCSAIYTNSRKDYTKIKVGPKKKDPIIYKHICKNCNKVFTNEKPNIRFCSRSCASSFRYKPNRTNRPALINYRADCSFKFSLNDFPDEFDFSLIEQFGWYRAKNRGDNLTGISRDHMISVKYGFDNNIDPKIISHPANCQLVRHNENSSKCSKCSITIEELYKRIDEWNNKYGS